jgi:hypothetical protein
MAYRNLPEPKSKTESLPIRWRDYLRYWVRVALRTSIHWLGIPFTLFAWLTSTSPQPEFGVTWATYMSYWLLGMWVVFWLVFRGQGAMNWAKEKDRLER